MRVLAAQGQRLGRAYQALDALPRSSTDRRGVSGLEGQRATDADRFTDVQRKLQLLRAEIGAAYHVDHGKANRRRKRHVDALQITRAAAIGRCLPERKTPQTEPRPMIK